MNDPYQVLNIPSTASDEEVKKAYRELARKYHPDNYHDNPLADLAQEKMKEINEAYEEIQKRRKTGGGASYSSAQSQHGGGYSTDSADPTMRAVRQALSRNETSAAERILAGCSNHNAEWNFLMGVVCSRRGLMDQARRYLQTAYSMEPGNSEYRQAVENMTQHYTPEGFRTVSTGSGNLLPWCLGLACCSTLGGYGCIPCFC